MSNNYPERLEQIASELLNSGDDNARLKRAAEDLYSLLSEITGLSESSQDREALGEAILSSGKAISPKDAARCVLDFKRTGYFVRAINAAIRRAFTLFETRPIHVVYAGCGPFAPLAIPLTTQFSSREVQFTLLEHHERSLDAAKQIFDCLGSGDFVREYVKCDAASYRANDGEIHMAVVEAMQAALTKEPQVAISLNLIPQLTEGGILIPQRITVDACLSDFNREFDPVTADANADELTGTDRGKDRFNLGRIFELPTQNEVSDGTTVPVKIRIPKDLNRRLDLMLVTTVTVFDSIILGDYESGLTYPKVLCDLGTPAPGSEVEFSYVLGPSPGFQYRVLSPE